MPVNLSELKSNDSYAFIHQTKNEKITKILNDGYIFSSSETGILGEGYEGEDYFVFLSLVVPNDKIKPHIFSNTYSILIFDPQMYMDYGMKNLCHFTLGWNYGNISPNKTTFFNNLKDTDYKDVSDELKLKLNLNYLNLCVDNLGISGKRDRIDNDVPDVFNHKNELVVYEKIPIDKYLKYILVSPYIKEDFIPEKYKHLVINDVENKNSEHSFYKAKKYIYINAWKGKNLEKMNNLLKLIYKDKDEKIFNYKMFLKENKDKIKQEIANRMNKT